jgi:hypothetical protein
VPPSDNSIAISNDDDDDDDDNNNNNNNKHEGKIGKGFKGEMEKQSNARTVKRNMDRQLISAEDTFLWLLKGNLKAETESEIVAAQDRAPNTKYNGTKILHTETDSEMQTVPTT